MPVQLLPIGPPTALVQNQVYALPAVECVLFTDAATPTIQVSSSVGFATNIPLVLTAGASPVTGGFIRATTTGVTITLKRD